MYSPKKDVPSYSLCSRLKELGYPQLGGGWYWCIDKGYYQEPTLVMMQNYVSPAYTVFDPGGAGFTYVIDPYELKYYVRAPTIVELKSHLPIELSVNEIKYYLYWKRYLDKNGKIFEVLEYVDKNNGILKAIQGSEPNACAKMLIILAKQGYIEFNFLSKEEVEK